MFVKDVDKVAFLMQFEFALSAAVEGNEHLDDAAKYACEGGGKRVRPLCVYLGARAVGGECDIDGVLALAVGLELVHNYSLVHDDLPAMDNDSMRRGKPSVHVEYGEANAILTGDLLLTMAMEVLLDGAKKYGENFAAAASEIAFGARLMAYGQQKDLAGTKNADEYLAMCNDKTGALIRAAFRASAIYAGADEAKLSAVTRYAQAIGLIFQLSDDLLDGDGAVEFMGRDRVNMELELQLLKAVSAAKDLDPALTEFACKLAARKK